VLIKLLKRIVCKYYHFAYFWQRTFTELNSNFMSQHVKARKGKFVQSFPRETWDLLGGNKNGWVEISEETQVVTNSAKVGPPDSGEKKKVKNQVVENTAPTSPAKTTESTDSKSETNTDPAQVVTNSAKVDEKFLAFVKENLTKSQIKDHFDEMKVEYKNTMNLEGLAEVLSVKYEGNIDAVKTALKITDTDL
jgi:hypothetical protein